MIFKVTIVGTVTERYTVEADTEQEARRTFESGAAFGPEFSEVTDVEIIEIKEESHDPSRHSE